MAHLPLCSVLLKGYDERGFIWYTNYDSAKVSDRISLKNTRCPYSGTAFVPTQLF